MKIDIRGVVQSVGLRPLVYNLARQCRLLGYVRDDASGVSIEVEGEKFRIEKFIAKIETESPPVAVIFETQSYDLKPVGYDDFIIRDSDDHEEKFVPISPDISTGSDCPVELFDPNDPRYRYPFINCTNCIHNRDIHIRTDDSVTRIWRGNETVLRRAREFAPFPLLLNFNLQESILACGAELKNSFCLVRDNFVFMSHHIGDLENLETLTSFEEGIEHFKRIFNIEPTLIAYDLHPEYLATKYALSLQDIPQKRVQHHHVHIVCCMIDNEIDGEVIDVSVDGTGYGTNGRIWGVEFLICDYGGFNNWATIKTMIDKGINSPMTSSSGRLFDAVSALVGIRNEILYEEQAAIELEMVAGEEASGYQFDLQELEDHTLLLIEPMFRGIVSDLERGVGVESISSKFHNTMAKIILSMCIKIRKTSGLEKKSNPCLFNILFCTFTFIICVLTLYPQPSVYAADVTLAWTSNTEGDLAGYYVYYKTGTSGEPYNGTGVDQGNSPIKIPIEEFADSAIPEYTLHGLSDTETSYLVLTAYDSDGNASGFSNEVSYHPATAPALSSLISLSISGSDYVSENKSAGFTATATFSDNTTKTVTGNAAWSENSMYAGINSSGVLTTLEVTEDTSMTIQAVYSIGGLTKTATKVMTILDVPVSNLPPDTPNIVYPENYSGDVEVPLVITTAAFSDPNNDDQIQSQWQISEQSDFSTLVVDITSDNYLKTFSVPHMALKSNHKYYVRVRFFDIYSAASNWSGTVEFTTAFFIVDININGISDADEVEDSVDFNLDGIPDNGQPQIIKCIRASDGSVSIGIERVSSSAVEIESLEVIDPDTISDTVNRPGDLIFGLFAYRLRVRTAGDIATIRIYFSGGIFASDVFYKYDTINGWYDYSEHTTFNDDGQSVTLELKDGGYGDSDGLANGVIVDPGGVSSGGSGSTYTDSSVSTGNSGGGGGCFITTASFGSKFEKHVQLLHRFRDLYLMPNRIGRTFVNAYYRTSPPMADFIAGHDTLRAMVRYSLIPLFGLIWLLLHFGMAPTLLFMVLMGFTTFLCYRKMPTS
jgi:acylphosphatase